MKAKKIIQFMDNWAPKKLAEDWDNVGFQVGNDDKEIKNILLSLDLDNNVYDEAIKKNCDMIITHHPFIFSGIKNINSNNYDGKLLMNIIKEDIVVFNAHTNLDQTVEGVNEELGRLFNLNNSYILERNNNFEDEFYGYGIVGNIEKQSISDFISVIKSILNIDYITLYGDEFLEIEKIALVGGSGSSFIKKASDENVELLITGDIKYHDAQLAEKLGVALIDAGHYHTEKIILPVIKRKLLEYDDGLNIYIYDKPSPNYKIL